MGPGCALDARIATTKRRDPRIQNTSQQHGYPMSIAIPPFLTQKQTYKDSKVQNKYSQLANGAAAANHSKRSA